MYDPTTNQAKWVPMKGTVADFSPTEERSALALCNLVPCDEEEVEERIDRFGKRRNTGNAVGGGAGKDPSQETPCKDEMELDEESRDWRGDVVTCPEVDDYTEVEVDDEDQQSDLGSMGQGPHRGCSWGERCESENKESVPFCNSRTQTPNQDVSKNFHKHCHPPHGRS